MRRALALAALLAAVGVPLAYAQEATTTEGASTDGTTTEETPPKVVNLMDALRQSLDRVSTGKKKTAKVPDAKPEKAVAATKAAPKKRAAR